MNTTDSSKVSDANAGANNVIHIPHNPTLAGLATLTRNVAYKTGADNLVMDIISPQSTGDDDDRRYPTVVFVQGSAWTTPRMSASRRCHTSFIQYRSASLASLEAASST